MKIYIIIPAYNEEGRIVETLEEYRKVLLGKYGDDIKLVVVSESTDNTNRIVGRYKQRHKQIKLYTSKKRFGKGGAIIRGFERACKAGDSDIIGFIDADPCIRGAEVLRMLNYLERTSAADGVIASRYLEHSRIIGRQSPIRFIASRAYNIMVRLLYGFNYRDTQCGAKFFRSKALCSILPDLAVADMSFDLNLLYDLKKGKFNVVEFPISYKMIYEGTKLDVKKQVPRMFIVAIGFRIMKSPFNWLVPRRLKGLIYHTYVK